jgi:hypothetical protein
MSIGTLTKQKLAMRKLVSDAEEALKGWSSTVLETKRPKPGPYAFFSHNAHALERLWDVLRILERLYDERIKLRVLDEQELSIMPKDWPPNTPFPSKVHEFMKKTHNVNEHLKMDFEALYMFGNVLLDQWALCLAYAIALDNPEDYNFNTLVRLLESEDYDGSLKEMWQVCGPQMLWLDCQIRFYRNRFVVHADRPWQRGNTRSTYGHDFALFVPSPPGWLDEKDIIVQIRALSPLAPEWLQNQSDDYWEKANPRALLTRLLDNNGLIRTKKDRDAIKRLVGQYGTTTPTFQIIGANILKFIKDSTDILIVITKENIDKVNLGEPKHKYSDV